MWVYQPHSPELTSCLNFGNNKATKSKHKKWDQVLDHIKIRRLVPSLAGERPALNTLLDILRAGEEGYKFHMDVLAVESIVEKYERDLITWRHGRPRRHVRGAYGCSCLPPGAPLTSLSTGENERL